MPVRTSLAYIYTPAKILLAMGKITMLLAYGTPVSNKTKSGNSDFSLCKQQ